MDSRQKMSGLITGYRARLADFPERPLLGNPVQSPPVQVDLSTLRGGQHAERVLWDDRALI